MFVAGYLALVGGRLRWTSCSTRAECPTTRTNWSKGEQQQEGEKQKEVRNKKKGWTKWGWTKDQEQLLHLSRSHLCPEICQVGRVLTAGDFSSRLFFFPANRTSDFQCKSDNTVSQQHSCLWTKTIPEMEKECCLFNIYGKAWDGLSETKSESETQKFPTVARIPFAENELFQSRDNLGIFSTKRERLAFYCKSMNSSFHLCPPPKCVSACWPLEVATSWWKRDSIIVCLTMTRWPVTIILRLIDFFHLFCFTWQGFEGCSWPPLREACQTNRQLLAACCFLGRCKHQLFCYTTNCMSQLS